MHGIKESKFTKVLGKGEREREKGEKKRKEKERLTERKKSFCRTEQNDKISFKKSKKGK